MPPKSAVKKPTPDLSGISVEWLKILDPDALPPIFDELKGAVVPPMDKVFEFARLTELKNIKVVIIGQDPYPKIGDAHGLAFSCLTGIPASLKNIFKCLLKNKLIEEIPSHGNLEYWAKQGVLLLNRSLTTVVGKPNAHADLWESYTTGLVRRLSAMKPLVFMLWGNNAKSLNDESIINKKSIVLTWSHPSPMAQSHQSFIECDNFSVANKTLIKLGREPIDWNVDPPQNEVEIAFGTSAKTQVIFTDGSCYPNKVSPAAVAGYAAAFVLGSFKDTVLYGNIPNKPIFASNQRGEGYAMLKTFEFLLEHINEWEDAIIVSDSDFWIKMHETYMPAWSRRGGEEAFDEKKNPDLTKALWKVYSELVNDNDKSITFRHVKSHDKLGWSKFPEESYEFFCHTNNDYVDRLATFARTELKPGQDVIEEANYEEDTEKNAKKDTQVDDTDDIDNTNDTEQNYDEFDED
jgi:uracil-DNA glycosylase